MNDSLRAIESRLNLMNAKLTEIVVDMALVKSHVTTIRRIGAYLCTIGGGVVTGIIIYKFTH
jgi:hypothetical protein